MIKILKTEEVALSEILTRETDSADTADGIAANIIADVKQNGDKALFAYTKKFDGAELTSLQVSQEEITAAVASLDEDFLAILKKSKENIINFHKSQIRNGFVINDNDGVVLGQKITPLERAGIYVPGGTASYPSSVLMNALPAKLAGVSEVIMVTPPSKDGSIPTPILAAAEIAGVDKIFKIGGAQAVAALALGTESVPKVDKIVGPGNVFVAAAKRRVYGLVDIDMIAGPSEILVIADGENDPKIVAGDLLSQAEHDRLASAVLITDSEELASKVSAELERQIPLLPRSEICRTSIDNNGKIIVAKDLKEAVSISNMIAPEHLELMVADPFALLSEVKHAGSIFLGRNTPEALGDYFAGPNHTLPTSGTARFSSPLSVDDFIKKSSFIYYTKEALSKVKSDVENFAEREGLSAHAKSVTNRF